MSSTAGILNITFVLFSINKERQKMKKFNILIALMFVVTISTFGAFPVKQLSLNQNSLTGNISSTEKYKMATLVFRFSDFQKAGYKQSAMSTFISNNSSVYEKSNISQNVMTEFSRRNQQKKGNPTLITGLVLLGTSLAGMLAGGLIASYGNGMDAKPGGVALFVLSGLLFLPGLIVTICGLATNNSHFY